MVRPVVSQVADSTKGRAPCCGSHSCGEKGAGPSAAHQVVSHFGISLDSWATTQGEVSGLGVSLHGATKARENAGTC